MNFVLLGEFVGWYIWSDTYTFGLSVEPTCNEYQQCEEMELYIPYFPAQETQFFPQKMLPKFDLRLMRRG